MTRRESGFRVERWTSFFAFLRFLLRAIFTDKTRKRLKRHRRHSKSRNFVNVVTSKINLSTVVVDL